MSGNQGKIPVHELRKLVQTRQRRRVKGFNRLVLYLNILCVAALLLAIAAKHISPALFWFPAFFGLAFPYLYVLNLLFFIYWFTLFKPVLVYSGTALLLGVPTVSGFVQYNTREKTVAGKELRVTSYNSMLFDLYNWSHNKESRSGILNSLIEIDPDILCLQEFYTSEETGDFNNLDTIKQSLSTPFHHTAFTTTLRKYDHWGIATFSRYPIVNEGTILFQTRSNNICIFSDIVINQDTIRVYNVHLQSISFSWRDHEFYENVLKGQSSDKLEGSRNILRRIKRAFVMRTKQVEMIVSHMKTCRYKIIVCGDFNDTAASYAYGRMTENLLDAFKTSGSGFGRTYAGKWPQFRIDYILYDPSINCRSYERSAETFTDHYPITARFTGIGL